MIPETGQYPWSWWGLAEDVLIVTSTPPLPRQSLEFSDEGPAIATTPYGKICFELMFDGVVVFTPWIHITVSPMIIPVPADFTGKYKVLKSFEPGLTVAIEVSDIKDLEKLPKPPKPPKLP